VDQSIFPNVLVVLPAVFLAPFIALDAILLALRWSHFVESVYYGQKPVKHFLLPIFNKLLKLHVLRRKFNDKQYKLLSGNSTLLPRTPSSQVVVDKT
jgi:hypothetical protein